MKVTANGYIIALSSVIMMCLLAVPAMADYTLDEVTNADMPVSGTMTGSYQDTHTSNDIQEVITEVGSSGGSPSSRISYLEHKWTINVTGGNFKVTFYLEANHTANSENDNFVFAYSTDDSIYTDMVTVTKTADDGTYQTYEMPKTLSDTIYIRVKDTDQTGGNTALDTIYVDHMYIRSVLDTTTPVITNVTGDTSSTTGEAKTISAAITDAVDVVSAEVHYTPIDGTETTVQMTEGAGDVWSADVPVASDKVGTITYYITAENAVPNTARDPATGTYNITVTDNDAPSTISDLTATAVAGGGIELAWSVASDNIGVVSYDVYRNLSAITDATGLTPIANVTETTHTDWSGDEGTTYYYAVTAVDAAGNEGDTSNSPSATPDAIPPAITIHSPTSTTYHTTIIKLEVSADEPVDQYQWWYNLNSEGNTSFTPNSTIIAQLGSNHLIVYASDTAGNENSSEVYFSTSNYINTCSVLNSENTTYYLTMDIINSTASACIVVAADNVTLDCQGHTIDGNLSLDGNPEDNKYGIYSNNSYTTIKNGKISNWQNGIYLDSGADNEYIENNFITEVFGASSGGNAAGIFLKSKYNVVYNNTISSLTGRQAGGTATGIYLENSNSNNLTSNSIYNLTGEQGVSGYYGWGGAGGTVAGVRLKNSTSNRLTSISISNLTAGHGGTGPYWPCAIAGMAMGIWIDTNSYDNILTELTTQGSYKIPEENKLNKINGKPILYFYNETGLKVSDYNITTNTAPIIISEEGSVTLVVRKWVWPHGWQFYTYIVSGEDAITTASGITLINTTDSIIENNTVSGFKGMEGRIHGIQGGTATGVYLKNSASNSLTYNTISSLIGGQGAPVSGPWNSGGTGGTAAGIYLESSSSNNLISTSISNLTGGEGGDIGRGFSGVSRGSGGIATGIYLNSSTSNSLTSNTVSSLTRGQGAGEGTATGIYLYSAANNVIYNNVFNSPDNYYFAGTIYPNRWNTTYHSETNVIGNPYMGGNYWGKPDGTGYSDTCWDRTGDYICEKPYILATNNTDYLPLTYNSFLPVWQHDVIMPWDVERLSDGNTLITEYGNNTVIEVTSAGEIVWQYGNGTAGSGENQLDHPIDAERLSDGNTIITDRDNNRVIEVDNTGTIIWEMNATDGLSHPWDAERLSDGNTLITDKHNNRVIEVDKNKAIVWEMTGLNHPEDAERLSNKNTLIADYRNHRVIEVNSNGDIVWQYGTTGVPGSGLNELNNPTDAERLPDGNTVIADHSNHRIIEVTPANKIIGQYGISEVAGSGENELNHPADAERLPDGNTLIADTDNNRVIEVIALLPPPPIIVSFTPSSPVYNPVGVESTFSTTIDQTVDVEWLLDGILVKSDTGVTESSYTNTSVKEGTWTVSAIASNADGTDMQQWDWTSAQGPELIVSRIDAYHNKTLYPKESYPPYFNLSNEIDVTVTNIGTEPVGVSNVNLSVGDKIIGKLPVPGLDPGASAIVQFKWTPLGYDCEDGGTPITYTLKAIADCDKNVEESVETNNELTVAETAYWAGYSADEELVEASHGTIRGGLLYTTGDGSYVGLYSHEDFKDTHYNIELPKGAAVKHARLNVYYTWSKLPSPVAGYPVMEVSITSATGTYTIPLAASYNDRPCDTPAIGFEYPWGNYVYDLTPYIQGSGNYTVRVTNSGTSDNPSNFCPAAPGLVIVYEDSSMPEYEYWILEGADILEGGCRGGAGNLAWWECTNNATFNGSIDMSSMVSATLGIVSVWGGDAWGDYTSYYWSNDKYLGNGTILGGYSSLYERTVDGMSMYVGASGRAQVGANVSDVTDCIKSEDNFVSFIDDGDSMMPTNAFLLVEYEYCREEKPEPAVLVPFMISGSVTNHSDGTPIYNPDVAIKNVNTGELLPDVETQNDSSYYQILTSLNNVSCGDVLQFTCDGTTLKHTVKQREMDVGGFVLDIAVGMMPEAIEAGVTFDLKRLDLNSSGILKAFITLPEGYNVTDINVSTVECEGATAFDGGSIIPGKQALEVKFKIPDLEDVPTGDVVLLTVTGELYDGTPFEASNTLKVV